MFFRLLFLLTFIPFLEIYFLIGLSDQIGFGNTLMVVFATGLLGAWLLRTQGHSILMEMQQASAQGQMPSEAITRGLFTFLGGVLLLTPGILTDGLGLSFILPLTQRLWKSVFVTQWQSGVNNGSIHFYSAQGGRSPFEGPSGHNPFGGPPPRGPFGDQERPRVQYDSRLKSDVIEVKPVESSTEPKKTD